MEDALISPEGFMILSGAGLIEASENSKVIQHIVETIDASSEDVVYTAADEENSTPAKLVIAPKQVPYFDENRADEHFAYVMLVKDGEIIDEPYIAVAGTEDDEGKLVVVKGDSYDPASLPAKGAFDSVIVDYYTARTSKAMQIDIEPGKFGGNFYLEASTLFRTTDGVDMPAEFVIPNCKIQSNFTFTMASSGDPSTFTFTLDAFPDYTRFDHSKKVLAAIQVIEDNDLGVEDTRVKTNVTDAPEG